MAGCAQPGQIPGCWLNIGPRGSEHHEPAFCLDIRPGVADVTGDIRALPFAEGSFSGVECHHVLEHLERDDAPVALREMHRVLRKGGTLDIAVPDMARCAQTLLAGNLDILLNIYSPHEHPAQRHRWGYVTWSLKVALQGVGFIDVRLAEPTDAHELRMVAVK